MAQPLVSVIIPAYNVERYLAAAIDSALAQSHPRVEVVVVDDGATDESARIAEAYGDRIVLVRQANRGLAGARNAGLRAAHGELIGLLDADDVWAPERIARCVARLEAEPGLGWVTTDAWLIRGETPTEERYYGDWTSVPFAHSAQLEAIARANFVFVGGVIRRSLLDRAGGFDESLRRSEDYDLWIRLLLGGARVGLVDEPLAGYRVRPDSLSADTAAQRDAHLGVLAKHLHALWRVGARGRPGDAYDVARRAERLGRRREAASAYLLGARDARLGAAARGKQVGAAVRALVRPRRG